MQILPFAGWSVPALSIPNGWHNFSSDLNLNHKHITIPRHPASSPLEAHKPTRNLQEKLIFVLLSQWSPDSNK
jgi:hypothetical protein